MSSISTDKIWSTSGSRYMYASASQTTNGSSANTSTISWTITTAGDSSTYYDTGPTYLWIGGVQRYYKARVSWSSLAFPAKAGSTSGSYTLTHNNDGSVADQEVKLSTAIYTGAWNASTVSKTWTLDKIARYFSSTPSISLASRTETSITLNWSTSETCSAIAWNGGGSNITTTGVPGTSGTVTFTGLTANTTYSIYGTFTRSDSSLTSNSGTGSYTTYNYPHVTSVGTANLTIGGSQTLSLYNPMSRTVTIKMYKSDGTLLYTTGTTTGTSITFTPTAATLYSSIPSNQSAKCYYSAICSSPSKTMNTSSSYTYKVTGNETPTLATGNVSTYDANTTVTAITGQTAAGGWLVQGQSTLKVAITAAATAQNSATISKYEVTFAGVTKTLTVGTTGGTWDVFNGSGNQNISIKVTDSRGLTSTITKAVTFVAYRAPSISLTAGRANNYGTTVNISATYTGSDVSGTNGVKVQWSGADQSGYLAGSASDYDTTESGTQSTTATGVNNETAYTFTATITDKFGKTASSSVKVPVGQPTMFVDVEQAGVGVNCLPKGQGLYVDGNLCVGPDGGKRLLQKFNIDLSGLSSDTFYPVLLEGTTDRIDCEIYSPRGSSDATWNQNAISFSMKCKGWSDTPKSLNIYHYGVYATSEITIGCIGGGNNSEGHICIWLRGSLNYHFYSNVVATLKDAGFTTESGEVYTTGTNYYGGSNSNVTIYFTPQSTITNGWYTTNDAKIAGKLSVNNGLAVLNGAQLGTSSSTCDLNLYGAVNFKNSGTIINYNDTTGSTLMKIGSNNKRTNLIRVWSSDSSYSDVGGYGYTMAYTGDGSGAGNKLIFFADNLAATSQVEAIAIANSGTVNFGSTMTKQSANVPAIFISSSAPTAKQTGDIWVT